MLRTEVARETVAEQFVQAFSCLGNALRARHEQGEVRQEDDSLQAGHTGFVEILPHLIAGEEHTRFGMVDNVMDVVRLEFMQDGHGDSTISYHSEESDHPVGAVTSADGYLVARTYAALFEHDMHLGHLSGYVFIA